VEEDTVRGKRVSRAARLEIDLVIVAARYDQRSGLVSIAQAYARRGPIWGDIALYDRGSIMALLDDGKTIAAGAPAELQGDFEIFNPISSQVKNGSQYLVAGPSAPGTDSLGVPLF
jgi:hypothetical protein